MPDLTRGSLGCFVEMTSAIWTITEDWVCE